eukprot:TRINITY_DN1408_c0_g3_i2.p2 TRINITY_DN1408_c0_g3~~TRINITY_DN1408_c0_g3_i2.p2  ORF type:complete len:113 (-),score=8.45 TRINITY_DN1408_c0_g3_i2:78-416(-)
MKRPLNACFAIIKSLTLRFQYIGGMYQNTPGQRSIGGLQTRQVFMFIPQMFSPQTETRGPQPLSFRAKHGKEKPFELASLALRGPSPFGEFSSLPGGLSSRGVLRGVSFFSV